MKHNTEIVQANESILDANTLGTISQTLKRLGIPVSILGFDYLRCGISLVMENPEYKNNIVKGLYEDIAKRCKTTGSRAERAIRHAIEVGYMRGDMTFYDEIFGNSIDNFKGRPTNSEFVAAVADYIYIECLKDIEGLKAGTTND